MKKFTLFVALITALTITSLSSPRISLNELLAKAEENQSVRLEARKKAVELGQPVTIITSNRIMIDAKGVEDGKIVYSVFTDLLNIYNGGYTAFYEEAAAKISLSSARIDYGNGKIIDNTGGMFDPVNYSRSGDDVFIMIPEWTDDKVYMFSAQNGDLLDPNLIPTTAPQLQSPKNALLHFSGKYFLVSDQLSDVVQRFDTNGTYIGVFAPSTGVNNAIMDNIRGAAYLPNKNLLVCVGSGANQNTIQQFDSGGVHLNGFITTGINSPFDILQRTSDILVTNSSGANRITRYNLSGGFLSNFYSQTNFNFPQQMLQLPNGNIAVCAFSTPGSGLVILGSDGSYIKTLTNVTGLRGAYLLDNGNYIVTNASGVHEIDSANGTLIRTISTAANFQYVSPYNPGILLSNGNNSTGIPSEYTLMQNYPNPFNPSTNIRFSLPAADNVKLTVYDINGKEAAVLVNGMRPAGLHDITFNGDGFSSGIYFYKLEAGEFSDQKKMVLVK